MVAKDLRELLKELTCKKDLQLRDKFQKQLIKIRQSDCHENKEGNIKVSNKVGQKFKP